MENLKVMKEKGLCYGRELQKQKSTNLTKIKKQKRVTTDPYLKQDCSKSKNRGKKN